MRIIVIALLVAAAAYGAWVFFGQPATIPQELVKVLTPQQVEKPAEEKKEPAADKTIEKKGPDTEERGVSKKASPAKPDDHRRVLGRNPGVASGRRDPARGDSGLSDTPPHLRHIPSSPEQQARAQERAAEIATAKARREAERANNKYFGILNELAEFERRQ